MKKIVMLAASAALAWSCSNPAAYTVKGSAEGLEGRLYLVNAETMETVDSTTVEKTAFRFKGEVETPFSAVIHSGEEVAPRFYARLIVEPGTILLREEGDDLKEVVASGTPSNDAMSEYAAMRQEIFNRYYSADTPAEERDALEARYDAAVDSMFAANSGNLFGAILLAQELAYDMPSSQMIETIGNFPEEIRRGGLLTKLHEQAVAKARSEVGQPYIDIAQPDADGKSVTLASVVGNPANKYVLVDFWASWCRPCMGEVPYLVEAYGNYHKRGFEIYGVSFDRERDPWLAAIANNKMNWVQVSELNYFDNAAAEAYAVRGIPSNFLVECATGKIVATQLRGEALEEKLAELFD